MQLLFLDFETYWNRKENYCLKSSQNPNGLSYPEYIRDPRFEIQGLGISDGIKPVIWLRPDAISEWTKIINWRETALVCHNAKFDGSILAWKYGIIPAQYVCTQAMGNAVLGTTVSSMSLAYLAQHFGFEPKGHLSTDGKRELTSEEEQQLMEYGLHDVELLIQIFNKMAPEFPESQYGPLDWTIRAFVQPQLQLDIKLLEECAIKEAARREEFFKRPGWSKDIFSSNKKFPEFLRSNGYEVPTKRSPRTGEQIPALALGDVKFLDMLEGEDEKLQEICEARVAAKSTLLETRSEKLAKIGKTGAWPFDVWFSGAKQTHRYSGGGAAGGNPQNFTRGSDLRRAVRAPKNQTLVVADFSKVEPTIVANLAGQQNLIDAFAEGDDVYSDFASEVYQKKINKKTNPEEYMFGKQGVIAPSYNMGWEKFQKRVRIMLKMGINEQQARRTIDVYRTKYWRIPKYWEYLQGCLEQMADGGFGELAGCPAVKFDGSNIILPSGLAIRYPNLRQEIRERDGKKQLQWVYDAYRKGKTAEVCTLYGGKMLENIAQALVGEICKEAIERIKDHVWLSAQIHDEVIGVVELDREEEAKNIVKTEMEKSPLWFPSLVLKAEVNSGETWLSAK